MDYNVYTTNSCNCLIRVLFAVMYHIVVAGERNRPTSIMLIFIGRNAGIFNCNLCTVRIIKFCCSDRSLVTVDIILK